MVERTDRAPALCSAFLGRLQRVLILGTSVKEGPTTARGPELWGCSRALLAFRLARGLCAFDSLF